LGDKYQHPGTVHIKNAVVLAGFSSMVVIGVIFLIGRFH
jgi:hypothetical protein